MRRLLRWSLVVVVPVVVYLVAVITFSVRWMGAFNGMPPEAAEIGSSFHVSDRYPDLAHRFQEMIRERRGRLHAPSISAAVAMDGRMVWAGAAGYARIENRQAADDNSQYRIGSTSKSLTAVALMKLVEEGKISLDQDIHTYLPEYPTPDAPITPRLLASHMAGIRHYRMFDPFRWPPFEMFGTGEYPTVRESLEQFEDDPLLFSPGSNFSYSTYGYVLLSAVMERAAGEDFAEIMRSRVFDPLGMTSTFPERADRSKPSVAGFYNTGEGVYGAAYPANDSGKLAGGGFVSTPSDLVKLGMALLADGFLSAESRAAMFEPQKLPSGRVNSQSYALGWRHQSEDIPLPEGDTSAVEILHHGGRSVGGASFFLLIPEYEIAVSVLSNSSSGEIRSGIQKLAYEMAGSLIEQKLQGSTTATQTQEN